ncbi:MAG: response regulator [Pseudobutyrivibrio sp.]|nr:response regulator [Pseudobutyrivibrio sp.]
MFSVIVVDDEKSIREGIVQLIDWKEIGCQVTGSFSNGKEALEFLESNPVDIVVTDIKMPEMDGLTLSAKIKEKKEDIDVIILTAYSDFSYAKMAISNGVTDFIIKNEFLEELPKAIEKIAATKANKSVASDRRFIACACEILETENSKKKDYDYLKIISNILKIALIDCEYQIMPKDDRCFTIVINVKNDSAVNLSTIGAYFKDIINMATEFMSIDIRFGLGTFVDSGDAVKQSLKQAMIALSRCEIEGSGIYFFEESKRNKKRELMQQVNDYIDSHYSQQVNLHMIASELYLNEAYLSRAYKNAAGITITEYLTNVRIEKAKELIMEGGMKLYEIADAVGFKDAAYFTNVFVKNTGVNPSEYKKLQLM